MWCGTHREGFINGQIAFRLELAKVALSPNDKYILIAVLAVVMILVVFFEMRYMRGKTKAVRHAAQKKDEAFNAVLTTRSVINVMDRQGSDTGVAQNLVKSAKEAMDRREYDRCIELCEKARGELVMPSQRKRDRESPVEGDDVEREQFERAAERILSTRDRAGSGDSYRGTKLSSEEDGNYLSARFEMNAAKADISEALGRGSDTSDAQDLLTQAEGAFVAGNHTKALSLAVRARKAANADVAAETIALRTAAEPEEPEAEPAAEESSAPSAGECRECGAPLDLDDAFCHKCGAKVVRERSCSSCGEKARPTDVFCRKCGERIG
jgi:hypothetical protein